MVSSRTPGVNNVTPANNAADNEADDVSSSPDGVDAGVGLGEDESRVNGGPENGSDGGVRRGGNGDGDSGRVGGGDDGGTANVGWSQSGPPSLSMSVDLHNIVTSTNHQDSGRYSVSPDHAGGATPAAAVVKIGCYDEEESYEGFGSVEGDADDGPDSPGGSSSAPSPTGTSSRRNPRSPNSTVGRHSWLRTSLRRTPPCSGRKRLSSNALASQLYRSGSFNSSGMGSNYDPADDVYSDVSLEDVMDLSHKGSSGASSMCASRSRQSYTGASRSNHDRNPQDDPYHPYYPAGYPRWPLYDPCAAYHYHSGAFYPMAPPYCAHHEVAKREIASWWSWFTILLLVFLVAGIWVGIACYRKLSNDTRRKIAVWLARFPLQVQMIQEQMHALVDTKSVGEERYARAKQENATLQARILMLEEAAKDAETRAEERLQAEQRRHREWACRLERERQLQLENYSIKLQAVELDSSSLRDEIARVREQLERARTDKTRLENDLQEARREADAARESERHAVSRANEAHHLLEAMREELSLHTEDQQRLEELVQQVAQLQARNKSLEESRDELQAAAALQAGRELLMLNPCNNTAEKGPSLAVELLAGMNPDQIDGQRFEEFGELCTMAEMKQALKEQQEVNTQLRTYIDGILLNIVENYPQLLEVKQTH